MEENQQAHAHEDEEILYQTSPITPPPAAEIKPSTYGKVPDKLVSFLVQLDLSDGVSLTLDAYRRQALFDRPECAISLPCRDLAIAERLVASLARHAWERIEGKIQKEKKRRYARIKKSLMDLVLVGSAILDHLRAEMLRQENTRDLYDDLEEALREAKILLVEAFGFKAGTAIHGSDSESVCLRDAGAPAPGEALPGAVDNV